MAANLRNSATRHTTNNGDSDLKFKLSKRGLVPLNRDNYMSANESLHIADPTVGDDEGICGKCDQEIEDFQPGIGNDQAVMCDICKTYYHQECGGLSDELMQIINRYGVFGSREIPWHCKICKKYANQLVGEMVDLRRRQDMLERDVKLIKSQLEGSLHSDSCTSNKEDVKRTVKEVLEQEKRQLNVIIQNLPDVDENTSQGKMLKSVSDLFRRKLDVSPKEIENTVKISTGRGYLVKVQLKNKLARKTVLMNAKRLKDDEIYKEVYLKPDLTYEQRQQDATLREELKKRKENGEKNLLIVRGKIVKAKPRIPPPSSESK